MIIDPYIYASSAPISTLKVNMLFNGADGSAVFTDEQGHTITTLVGAPGISTAQSVSGGSSLYLNGGAALTSADSSDYMFYDDFKIECWVYPTTLSATGVIYSNQISNGDANGFAFYRNGSGLDVWCGGTNIISASSIFTVNTWIKVKIERVSGVLSIYANDIAVGSPASTSNPFNSGWFRLGVYSVGGQYWTGYIDNFEIWSS